MSGFLPWKIMHLAVRGPLPDLEAERNWAGLFLVFWCDDVPVGQMSIPGPLLPITSAQLTSMVPAAIAAAVGNRLVSTAFPAAVLSRRNAPSPPPDPQCLLKLERPLEACAGILRDIASDAPQAGDVPTVSIVICTSNRADALRTCLSSICRLSPPPHQVVVVDMDPSSGLTARVTAAFPGVRYVPESRQGLSVARNAGIRACAGAVVAFTDDDVSVHPGWIRALHRVFGDSTVMASTGLVLPAELATAEQFACQARCVWDFRASEFGPMFFRSWRHIGVPTWRLGASANMAFRRDAFERVGYFDERLGAGASGSSENTELWYRLLAEGHLCRYEPAGVVFTHWTDWQVLSAQTFLHMRGHVAALLFQFDRYRHWGNLERACLRLPRRFLALAFRAAKRAVLTEDGGKGSLLLPLGPQVRGAFAGLGYYLRYRWLDAGTGDATRRASRPAGDYPSDSTGGTPGV